ncbi:MAG: hypothetical protein ACU84Q_08740 [Gammaproteobacteria bacterium]
MRCIVLFGTITLAVVCGIDLARATALDDIGYSELEQLLGDELPDGSRSVVDQTEASTAPEGETDIYLANGSISSFPNTVIVDRSGINDTVFSGHATSVAQRIGGISGSQLPRLVQIDGYEANDWLNKVLRRLMPEPPMRGSGEVGNHSWIGTAGSVGEDVNILRRMDWLISEDDYFHAVGASSASNSILFAYAMNVVVVKNTAATLNMVTQELDTIYRAGRPAIHLVVPESSPSAATGVVTSAATLLKELSPNAPLAPEVFKAILMAGAERETNNSGPGNIDDYGAAPSQNGLDYRYGAGQLNILNSYQILAAGIQRGGAAVSTLGYDFEQSFGAQNQTTSYFFVAGPSPGFLSASLVWNLNVNSLPELFISNPILYNLDLALFDITDGGSTLIATSNSDIDNTENIGISLQANRHYELQVSHHHHAPFNWPYALAWRLNSSQLNPAEKQVPLLPILALASLCFLLATIGWRAQLPQC